MKPLFLFLLLSFTFINLHAQELTGEQLLDKTIQVHDPLGNWENFEGQLNISMQTPDGSSRLSHIYINLSLQHFQLVVNNDSIMSTYKVEKDKAMIEKVNLKASKASMKSIETDNKKAILMRDYYTYLYGLPMKLKDQGTKIDPIVERKTFKGQEYLVLKVTYDKNVGSDVWFFYFDPETFKMEIYQFFKTDESGKINSNSGEYILLSENHLVNDINMPKIRKWYYNKNDEFLGTDEIKN